MAYPINIQKIICLFLVLHSLPADTSETSYQSLEENLSNSRELLRPQNYQLNWSFSKSVNKLTGRFASVVKDMLKASGRKAIDYGEVAWEIKRRYDKQSTYPVTLIDYCRMIKDLNIQYYRLVKLHPYFDGLYEAFSNFIKKEKGLLPEKAADRKKRPAPLSEEEYAPMSAKRYCSYKIAIANDSTECPIPMLRPTMVTDDVSSDESLVDDSSPAFLASSFISSDSFATELGRSSQGFGNLKPNVQLVDEDEEISTDTICSSDLELWGQELNENEAFYVLRPDVVTQVEEELCPKFPVIYEDAEKFDCELRPIVRGSSGDSDQNPDDSPLMGEDVTSYFSSYAPRTARIIEPNFLLETIRKFYKPELLQYNIQTYLPIMISIKTEFNLRHDKDYDKLTNQDYFQAIRKLRVMLKNTNLGQFATGIALAFRSHC